MQCNATPHQTTPKDNSMLKEQIVHTSFVPCALTTKIHDVQNLASLKQTFCKRRYSTLSGSRQAAWEDNDDGDVSPVQPRRRGQIEKADCNEQGGLI